jgi:alkylhydroperoxidase/carboxymuconolactone decarboxylase family protein YurZ
VKPEASSEIALLRQHAKSHQRDYAALAAKLDAAERALASIANSSCCGCCQEAAKVARKALERND